TAPTRTTSRRSSAAAASAAPGSPTARWSSPTTSTTSSARSPCTPRRPRARGNPRSACGSSRCLVEQVAQPEAEAAEEGAALDRVVGTEEARLQGGNVNDGAPIPGVDEPDLPHTRAEVFEELLQQLGRGVVRADDLDRQIGHNVPGGGPRDGSVTRPALEGDE